MKRFGWVCLLASALAVTACGPAENNGENNDTNNGMTANNGTTGNNETNNGTTNNGVTNNGVTNNGTTNNGTTNNGTTNNGTNTTNNGTTNGPFTVEDFGTAVFEAYCEAAFDCAGSDFYIYDEIRYLLNTYGTKADCLAAAPDLAKSGLYGEDELISAVNAGRLGFDPVVAQACIEAIQASLCDEEFEETACDGMFTGLVPVGMNCASDTECAGDMGVCELGEGQCYGACNTELCGGVACLETEYCDTTNDVCTGKGLADATCSTDNQCADGLVCDYNFDASVGTCVAEASVAAGGTCYSDDVCVADHQCDSATDTCVALSQSGGPCSFSSDCAGDLLCNYDFDTSTGVCVAEKSVADGAYCYDSRFCMDGSYCDFDTDTCVAGNKPAGTECVFDRECATDLVCLFPDSAAAGSCSATGAGQAGATCDRDSICADGLICDVSTETCGTLMLPGDGEVCEFDSPCTPGLTCLDYDETTFVGTCGALRGVGEACQDFTQCAAPNYCDGTVCVAPAADGATYENLLQCSSLNCNDDGTCGAYMACMVP